MIRRGPDSPCNFGATSPEPVTTAAPPRRECARRGLDPIPPPNRKDETMQDTVDHAHDCSATHPGQRHRGRAPGCRAFGTSGSQGSLGKDPGSIEGNDGAALSLFDGCRVLGRGLQEATVAGMLGVRPGQVSGYRGHSGEFGRPMLTLSDRLDQLVPAEDCEAAVAFGTAGEI